MDDVPSLIDPLDKVLVVLVACLVIGVANQFYGLALKGYGLIRRGRYFDAFCDVALWFLALPGFGIVAATLITEVPDGLFRAGVALLGVGGAGLVLTQGRNETGLFAKAVTGLVSLYGIVGTYGCASFLSDTLSDARLLALGLTTGIVAMAFSFLPQRSGIDSGLWQSLTPLSPSTPTPNAHELGCDATSWTSARGANYVTAGIDKNQPQVLFPFTLPPSRSSRVAPR